VKREREPQSPASAAAELDGLRAQVMALVQLRNELIAKLAHDIRGPLTSIVGFSELLEERALEGEAATDAARTIRVNAGRLTQLTRDLLAINRAEPGEIALANDRVNLNKLLAELATLSESAAAEVTGDGARLKLAFEALIDNAKRFSTNGQSAKVHVKNDGTHARVTIADAGIGIPAEELENVGTRFFRASNARKAKLAGTGVGVFVAKHIVEAHGGKVGIRSVEGQGTTIEVTLPIKPEKKSVSLALSDVRTRVYLTHVLRERGYRVVESGADIELTDGDVPPGFLVADVLRLVQA
jgi:signal transduction histidine kinase